MTDEQKKVSAFKIEIQEVDDGREATVMILSGMMYFFSNYRYWTIFIIVALTFVIWQSLTNFQAIKAAVDTVAAVGGV